MLPFHCPIMPDEHIFSWINRIHILMGYPKLTQTLSFMGIRNLAFKAYVYNQPMQDAISFYRREVSDDPSAFERHTPLPIWSLSVSSEYFANWKADNCSKVVNGDLFARAFRQAGWKYCQQCVKNDLEKWGYSYWHSSHQLPGITHCCKHNQLFIEDPSSVRDLRKTSLPQVETLSTQINGDAKELLKWSTFVNSINASILSNILNTSQLRISVQQKLQIPENVKLYDYDLPIFKMLQKKFVLEFPRSVFQYLFSSNNINSHREVNIFNITMGAKYKYDSNKIVHPIYWLAILYWLRDDLSLTSC